jgi:hypothetical protein
MKVREALVVLSRINPDSEVELKFPYNDFCYRGINDDPDYGDVPYARGARFTGGTGPADH